MCSCCRGPCRAVKPQQIAAYLQRDTRMSSCVRAGFWRGRVLSGGGRRLLVCPRVCHQTRQGMMLSAAEDMRATIYNSPPSRRRRAVLARGAGVCLWVHQFEFMQQSQTDRQTDRAGCDSSLCVSTLETCHTLTGVEREEMIGCLLMSRIVSHPN